MPNAVSPDILRKLTPGQSVTLLCCTTDADIYYYGPPEEGRRRVTPTPFQLRATHYEESGVVEGIEEGEFSYLVLSAVGESVVLSEATGHARVVGYLLKLKLRHVPLSAIVRVKKN